MIWITNGEAGPPAFEPLGSRQMVEALIGQAFNLDEYFERGIGMIVRLARGSRKYRLSAPNPAEAWEALRGKLPHSGTRTPSEPIP